MPLNIISFFGELLLMHTNLDQPAAPTSPPPEDTVQSSQAQVNRYFGVGIPWRHVCPGRSPHVLRSH